MERVDEVMPGCCAVVFLSTQTVSPERSTVLPRASSIFSWEESPC